MMSTMKMSIRANLLGILIPCIMLGLAMLACIPPQDCISGSFVVKGYIVDQDNQPIADATIRIWNRIEFEGIPAFDEQLASDKAGYFESSLLSSFGCTPFQVEVHHEAFLPQTLTFYPPQEDWPNELPPEITVRLQTLDG
jgi:hypothetical protein